MKEMGELAPSRTGINIYQSSVCGPEEDDLVLLQRLVVDKDKRRKLESRCEGPYLLVRIAKEGISGYI